MYMHIPSFVKYRLPSLYHSEWTALACLLVQDYAETDSTSRTLVQIHTGSACSAEAASAFVQWTFRFSHVQVIRSPTHHCARRTLLGHSPNPRVLLFFRAEVPLLHLSFHCQPLSFPLTTGLSSPVHALMQVLATNPWERPQTVYRQNKTAPLVRVQSRLTYEGCCSDLHRGRTDGSSWLLDQ